MYYLIINADDLNQSEETNKGIHLVLSEKIVKSASIIVNKDLLNSTKNILQTYPKVSYGLHFNITRGVPTSHIDSVESIVNESGEFDLDNIKIKIKNKQVVLSEVYTELDSQVRKFIDLFGVKPTHIDSHHYIHSFPCIRKILLSYCKNNNYLMRRPESPYKKINYRIKNTSIMPDYISFIFRRSNVSIQDFKNVILGLKCGVTELPCHVRYDEKINNKYFSDRNLELKTLSSTYAKQIVCENNIKLISYKDLNKFGK